MTTAIHKTVFIPDWIKGSEVIKVIETSVLITGFKGIGWVSYCGRIAQVGDGYAYSTFWRWELPEIDNVLPKLPFFDYQTVGGRHVSLAKYETWEEAVLVLTKHLEAQDRKRICTDEEVRAAEAKGRILGKNSKCPKGEISIPTSEELMEASYEELFEEIQACGLNEGLSEGGASIEGEAGKGSKRKSPRSSP